MSDSPNLLMDQWIRAERSDGTCQKIAPWQITSDFDANPVVQIHAPTDDLEASLYEFLIGLVNTFFLPEINYDINEMYENPLTPDELREKFEKFSDQFYLFDDEFPFMQERSEAVEEQEPSPLHLLPVNGPTDNAIKENRDLHTKEGFIESICSRCSGLVLYSSQTRAIFELYRYEDNFRSANHVTTLIMEETLWETICSNLISAHKLETTYGEISFEALEKSEFKFPWTRDLEPYLGNVTYGKDQQDYTPDDGHPLEIFWSYPRRFLLEREKSEEICDLCGETTAQPVTGFRKDTFGLSYEGPWLHPNAPYEKVDDPGHLNLSNEGLIYRDWSGLIYGANNLDVTDGQTLPSMAVQNIDTEKSRQRVWSYAFQTFGPQNNRVGEFEQSRYPRFSFENKAEENLFRDTVEKLVNTAIHVHKKNVRFALKCAVYGSYSTEENSFTSTNEPDGWWDEGLFAELQEAFWVRSEEPFFELLEELWEVPTEDRADRISVQWLQFLRTFGLELFDEFSVRELDQYDRERIFARNQLDGQISPKNGSIQEKLGPLFNGTFESKWKQKQGVEST